MNIKQMPNEERPVEKLFAKGAEALNNAELIAVLLGTGNRSISAIGLAENILASRGGLNGLADISVEELTEIPGIGPMKAASVICALTLGRRVATSPREKRLSIKTTNGLAEYFMEDMRYSKKEYFKVLMVNVKLEVIGVETVSIGELSGAPVHPRETFAPAIRKGAAAVCFAHNHPSGDPRPSDDDLKITRRLVECGDILGIRVLDHIIIGDGTYTSLKEEGYII